MILCTCYIYSKKNLLKNWLILRCVAARLRICYAYWDRGAPILWPISRICFWCSVILCRHLFKQCTIFSFILQTIWSRLTQYTLYLFWFFNSIWLINIFDNLKRMPEITYYLRKSNLYLLPLHSPLSLYSFRQHPDLFLKKYKKAVIFLIIYFRYKHLRFSIVDSDRNPTQV